MEGIANTLIFCRKKSGFLHFCLLWIFANCVFNPVFSQPKGKPFIRNYPPKEYNGYPQNFAIVSDKRGVMYFGNSPGVLEYDGKNWTMIELDNKSVVRSMAVDTTAAFNANGVIYVGSVDDFGYLAGDSTGNLRYSSLLQSVDTAYHNFGDVWRCYTTSKHVYFQTPNHIFRLPLLQSDTVSEEIKNQTKVFTAENRFHVLFKAGNSIFIRDAGVGLKVFRNDSLVLAPHGELLSEERIYTILPYSKTTKKAYLMGVRNKGLLIYEPGRTKDSCLYQDKKFDDIKKLFVDSRIYKGIALSDTLYGFATLRNGVIIINQNGQVRNHINKSDGLQNETVIDLYFDGYNGLWLALNNGISVAEICSPVQYWDRSMGVKETVFDIARYQNRLFIATILGICVLSDHHFKDISGLQEQSYSLVNFRLPSDTTKSVLMAGTGYGVYQIDLSGMPAGVAISDSAISKVLNSPYIMKLYQSKIYPSLLISGSANGISLLRYQNGQWIRLGDIKGIHEEIRSISEDESGNLWLGTLVNGVIKINLPPDIEYLPPSKTLDIPYKKYGKDNGLPVDNNVMIYRFPSVSKIIFATEQGFYQFSEADERFTAYQLVGQERYNTIPAYIVAQDYEKNIWLGAHKTNQNTVVMRRKTDGSYQPDTLLCRRIPFMVIESIYPDKENTWIGGSDGLYRVKNYFNKKYNTDFYTLIRKVIIGEDSLAYSGYCKKWKNQAFLGSKLPYTKNSITFEYSAAYFTPSNGIEYSFFLEGYDNHWSMWTEQTKKEYTNLPEGDYIFMVKAKNIYGFESRRFHYHFIIQPPWYRTWWAYLLFALAAILFVWAVVKINIKRLQIAKRNLERLVKERTAEISKKNRILETQKAEIEQQKNELEQKNDLLERKNEEIRTQHDELLTKNEIIEQKNKHITDSIVYAQRIQKALLSPQKYIERYLDDYFIMLIPKEIVSGDFYWIRCINNFLLIVAADCTGHGVPGAFMSMLGIAFLNEITSRREITQSHEALEALRKEIKDALWKTDQRYQQKDGMDIALCAINKETRLLQFSGAYNPLYIIRNKEFIEYKGNKMPIGSYINEKPFTNHEISLQKGDCLYMFSDGFVDQVGEKCGRKFLKKRFKQLLHDIHHHPMPKQKEILSKTLASWKGERQQIDDVLVVGFRITDGMLC